jgi:hypothetical protein
VTENMPSIWNDHFGFISKLTGNACVVGEWGGKCKDLDHKWMEAFTKVIPSIALVIFF